MISMMGRIIRHLIIIPPSIAAGVVISFSVSTRIFSVRNLLLLLLLSKRIFRHQVVRRRLLSVSLIKPIPDLRDTLTEIYLNSSVIYERIVHFEVSLSGLILASKLDKCIL